MQIIDPKEYGIDNNKAETLTKGLDVVLKERENLISEFKTISELEILEENIPKFKELRLKIVKNRTQGINKWHKASKEFFLAGGRFVDAIKNKENQVNQEMETKLMDAEKHFENLEKARIEKLNKERIKLITPYIDDVFGLDLGNMAEDVFNAYFESKKKEHEERIEAEKRAEEERLENERLDKLESYRKSELAPYSQFFAHSYNLREMSEKEYSNLKKQLVKAKKDFDSEQGKIKLENERLKKERKEAEAKRLLEEKKRKEEEAKKEAEYQAKLKKEREAREKLEREAEAKRLLEEKKRKEEEAKKEAEYQAKLKKEREAREKLEREAEARKEAELKAKKEAEELAKAPIKKQLSAWVNGFELPETNVSNKVSEEIAAKFETFKKWSLTQINNL